MEVKPQDTHFISGALSSKPEAFATCDVKQFTFENGPMGTLAANVLWNSKEEQIEIDAIANEADDKNTLIEGYVSPKRNYIDFRYQCSEQQFGIC